LYAVAARASSTATCGNGCGPIPVEKAKAYSPEKT
jgi:hypothetical protein